MDGIPDGDTEAVPVFEGELEGPSEYFVGLEEVGILGNPEGALERLPKLFVGLIEGNMLGHSDGGPLGSSLGMSDESVFRAEGSDERDPRFVGSSDGKEEICDGVSLGIRLDEVDGL